MHLERVLSIRETSMITDRDLLLCFVYNNSHWMRWLDLRSQIFKIQSHLKWLRLRGTHRRAGWPSLAGHCCHCNIVAQNTTITPLTSLVFRIISSPGHQLNCKDDFRLWLTGTERDDHCQFITLSIDKLEQTPVQQEALYSLTKDNKKGEKLSSCQKGVLPPSNSPCTL